MSAEELFHQGQLAYQKNDYSAAAHYAHCALTVNTQNAAYYFLFGLSLSRLGKLLDAEQALRQAISLAPQVADAHHYLGLVLQEQGQAEAALASYQQAISLFPQHATALNNAGYIAQSLGQFEHAEAYYRQAIAANPHYLHAHNNLADLLLSRARSLEAAAIYQQALAIDPNDFNALCRLGTLFASLMRFTEATALLERATALRPANSALLCILAFVQAQSGQTELSQSLYRQALSIDADCLTAIIGERLSLPAIYRNQEEIWTTRENYRLGLNKLTDKLADYHDPASHILNLTWCNFFLSYQGEDDKFMQVQYGELLHGLLKRIMPQHFAPIKKDLSRKQLRVGFASRYLYDSTVGHYFQSWLTALNRERFETYFYNFFPGQDAITNRLSRAADHVLQTSSIEIAIERIVSDKLDILIYPELGMDTMSLLLATLRLAPMQYAAWGHPVTSGLPNIDYFFSCAGMEPIDAQDHYSERLILLDGIGTSYACPAFPDKAQRKDFQLPEHNRLYLSPQSLYKVHPENDALFAEVLKRDPQGVLVFFQADTPTVTQQFANRLEKSLARRHVPPQARVKFLPRMPRAQFRQVMSLCDVMLDTLHWSGGNTSLDALAVGLPIVTLPGRFMRGRQSMAMLKILGLDELIARDHESYLQTAMTVAEQRDPKLRQRIIENHPLLFNRMDAIRALETQLISLYESV